MSKYTTELRFICEQLSCLDKSVDYSNIDLVVHSAVHRIFDFDFPIFDESYKHILCEKILKHFYTKEIGFETYALWKLKLNVEMNEIMPYYNQLYKSELLKFNPFYDVDVQRTHKTKNNENKDTKSDFKNNGTTHNENVYSDTPQGGLNGVLNKNYLTNATVDDSKIENESTSNEKQTLNNIEDYAEKVIGKQGTTSYSKMLKEFRETFLNIDMQIINALEDLFMLLW